MRGPFICYLILSQSFAKRYSITNRLLGSGICGKVYLATEVATKRQLACKVVNLRAVAAVLEDDHSNASREQTMRIEGQRLIREIEILTRVNHVCEIPPSLWQQLTIVAEHCGHEKGFSL